MSSVYEIAKEHVGDPDTFAERLVERMARHGLSHARVAIAANMAPTQLYRYIRGVAVPSLESMLRLDDAVERAIYGG